MGHTMSIHSQNEAGHPRVRPAQAGVPHLREHADDARVDRADDRARSGDDARLRRIRRQHHVRQHLAEAPAEHQAPGLRIRDVRAGRGARRRRRDSRPPASAVARLPTARAPAKPAPDRSAAGARRRGSTSSWRRAGWPKPGGDCRGRPSAGTPCRGRPPGRRRRSRPVTVRLRRRRAPGAIARDAHPGQRTDHHHARRARPRRGARGFRRCGPGCAVVEGLHIDCRLDQAELR